MAFSDWTYAAGTQSGDNITAGLDSSSTHIEALKSLLFQTALANNPSGAMNMVGRNVLTEFGADGNDVKVQTMFRVSNSSNIAPAVFLQMPSISTASSGYILVWTRDPVLALYKGTFGTLTSTSPTAIATLSPTTAFSNNSIYALALQCHWASNSSTMFLAASYDPTPIASPDTYDFSTCTEQYVYSDTSSPIHDNPWCGIGEVFINNTGGPGTNTKVMDLDVTQIFSP